MLNTLNWARLHSMSKDGTWIDVAYALRVTLKVGVRKHKHMCLAVT